MKILFFIDTLGGGGAERVLANLAGVLAERGHEVAISVNKSIQVYEVNTKVEIYFARKVSNNTGGSGIVKIMRQVRNFLSYIPCVKKIIKEYTPDVIITFMHCNIVPILLFHNRIPVISSERAAMDNPRNSYWGRFVFNRFVDKVTVLTPYDKGYAAAKGLKDVIIMPNPLTWPVMEESEYEESFAGRKNILACGRVDAWKVKGFDLLIRAFALIAQKYPDWKIDIAGKGSEESICYLQRLAAENGIEKRIHFMGFQKDVRSVMKDHSIFVLSSRTEGFPNVLSEAMSVGTAPICFDRLANSIVNDNVDGILVEDQNIRKLSQALEKLMNNGVYRHQVGFNAIHNIKRYSSEKVVERWESVMEEIVSPE